MAIKAQGTTVMIDATIDGTPDVIIGNIKSFDGFDGEASEMDVTHLGSNAKEIMIGIMDSGSLSFEFFPDFTDAGQNELRTNASAGTSATFELATSDGTTATFVGVVKNAQKLSGSVDSPVEGSATIRITGETVWT